MENLVVGGTIADGYKRTRWQKSIRAAVKNPPVEVDLARFNSIEPDMDADPEPVIPVP